MALGPPKKMRFMFRTDFFAFLGALGPLGGPRASKNQILSRFPENPKIIKKRFFNIGRLTTK